MLRCVFENIQWFVETWSRTVDSCCVAVSCFNWRLSVCLCSTCLRTGDVTGAKSLRTQNVWIWNRSQHDFCQPCRLSFSNRNQVFNFQPTQTEPTAASDQKAVIFLWFATVSGDSARLLLSYFMRSAYFKNYDNKWAIKERSLSECVAPRRTLTRQIFIRFCQTSAQYRRTPARGKRQRTPNKGNCFLSF